MKKMRIVFGTSASILLIATSILAAELDDKLPAPPDGKAWKLIWHDEFDGTKLDETKWEVAEGRRRPVMLITSDSAFLFHIAELETAARERLPLVCVVGVDHQWGLEVGVYKRTFEQPSPQPGVHWSKDVRMDKIAEGFGCHGEYVEKEDEIGPAIQRAYASGKSAVVHVCSDPKANSEELPKYDRCRSWSAAGTP